MPARYSECLSKVQTNEHRLKRSIFWDVIYVEMRQDRMSQRRRRMETGHEGLNINYNVTTRKLTVKLFRPLLKFSSLVRLFAAVRFVSVHTAGHHSLLNILMVLYGSWCRIACKNRWRTRPYLPAASSVGAQTRLKTFEAREIYHPLKILSIGQNNSPISTTFSLTPWSESASELYRSSDRRLSAKWLPTFEDRKCQVVSVTDPYGRILSFLDRSRYFSIK
jgi:hypothetical protein